jgi:hypothetical protein
MRFTLKFLQDLPLYKTERPYKRHGFAKLPAEEQTNCIWNEVQGIFAQDLRNFQNATSFEEEGFEFIKAPTKCTLRAEAFETESSQDTTVEDYVVETTNFVKEKLDPLLATAIEWRVCSEYSLPCYVINSPKFRRNLRLESSGRANKASSVATPATAVHCG